MPSQDNRPSGANRPLRARRIALLSIFLAYALVVGLIERMIPLGALIPGVPGIRLGLANIVILVALYIFPMAESFMLMLLKSVLTSLLAGSPVSMFYSITGSVLAFLGMLLLIRLFKERVSPIGVSVAGAALHNTGQILAAGMLMQTTVVFALLPYLLLVAVTTGTLTGFAGKMVLKRWLR